MDLDIGRLQPFIIRQLTVRRREKKFELVVRGQRDHSLKKPLGVFDDAAPPPSSQDPDINTYGHMFNVSIIFFLKWKRSNFSAWVRQSLGLKAPSWKSRTA